MVGQAMRQLGLQDDSLLLIENVGNLVCPASFDLGEAHKVVILSVTEGEDKPLKYPDMFRAAEVMLLNKCDLLPHLEFDADLAIEYARRINHKLQVIRISATSGAGMPEWLAWIKSGCRNAVAAKRKRRLDKIVALPFSGPSILACGAWLKNTVCVTRGSEAHVSRLIGDLDSAEARQMLDAAWRACAIHLMCNPGSWRTTCIPIFTAASSHRPMLHSTACRLLRAASPRAYCRALRRTSY